MADVTEKILNIGILGGLALAAFAIWNYFKGSSNKPTTCPTGFHLVTTDKCGLLPEGIGKAWCQLVMAGGVTTECVSDGETPLPGCTLNPQTCYNSGMDFNAEACTCDGRVPTTGCEAYAEEQAQTYVSRLNRGIRLGTQDAIWLQKCDPTLYNIYRNNGLLPISDAEVQICIASCDWAPNATAKANCILDCQGLWNPNQ